MDFKDGHLVVARQLTILVAGVIAIIFAALIGGHATADQMQPHRVVRRSPRCPDAYRCIEVYYLNRRSQFIRCTSDRHCQRRLAGIGIESRCCVVADQQRQGCCAAEPEDTTSKSDDGDNDNDKDKDRDRDRDKDRDRDRDKNRDRDRDRDQDKNRDRDRDRSNKRRG